MRVAAREMAEARTGLPLLVSHRVLLEREGPLGQAWLKPGGGWKPELPLPQPSQNNTCESTTDEVEMHRRVRGSPVLR